MNDEMRNMLLDNWFGYLNTYSMCLLADEFNKIMTQAGIEAKFDFESNRLGNYLVLIYYIQTDDSLRKKTLIESVAVPTVRDMISTAMALLRKAGYINIRPV